MPITTLTAATATWLVVRHEPTLPALSGRVEALLAGSGLPMQFWSQLAAQLAEPGDAPLAVDVTWSLVPFGALLPRRARPVGTLSGQVYSTSQRVAHLDPPAAVLTELVEQLGAFPHRDRHSATVTVLYPSSGSLTLTATFDGEAPDNVLGVHGLPSSAAALVDLIVVRDGAGRDHVLKDRNGDAP